jgi:ATP-dependent exoDNAse (exonuclease V) beta subunit
LRLTANFLKSPLAAQARTAPRVLKEFPLLFETPEVLLRGKLDLAFEDKFGWTLVDYKSDRRISDERLKTYMAQASLYAQGWEGLTGASPYRVLLFFLNTAQEVEARK